VKALAQDKKTDEPDLSFLNNLEELSDAVEELHTSWEARRNQLEAAVAENKIVIEVLPDALFILDKEQRIVRTNGMARLMFGHRIIHKKLEEVLPVTDLINAVENVTQVKDVEFQRMDGELKRDFIAKVTKFPASSPSTTDVIVTLHDLTLLKQIRKMQADFVANASHEMKTPLASIIGLTETLQTAAKDDIEARDEFLKIIHEQAIRMKKLVEDLLSLSKIEADTTPPCDHVDLVRLIEEAAKHCKWAADQKQVNVVINIKNDLPIIQGDEGQLGQVLINLISNAIKYGFANSNVVVEAKITRKLPVDLSEKYDKAVEISVIDKSEGIAPEHLPRLTERFYRVYSGRCPFKQHSSTSF
jgi:two-component system phosphate regulon sensor histidine kinase PhoR